MRVTYFLCLLIFFQYGRKDIESAQIEKRKLSDQDSEDEGYSEELAPLDKAFEPGDNETPKKEGLKPNGLSNGHINGGNNLIRYALLYTMFKSMINF